MQLVEKHMIDRNHWLYKQLDNLCFLSKNLFNYANYLIRQKFILSVEYLDYYKIQKLCQGTTDYLALPAKVSQQVLLRLHESWKSFFEATKEYSLHPEKFKARPKIPRYKHKTLGRNVLTYTAQAISKEWLNKGIINLSKTNIFLTTKVSQVNQVRIVPKTYHYAVEVVYEQKYVTQSSSGVEGIAGIDIGLNNLATITSNQKRFFPLIINGKPLKSINAYYHKKKTVLQSYLKGERKTSIKIEQLTHKRNVKVDNYLHNASRFIVNYLAANRIGTLVIGKNDEWKQEINLGRRNNQNFVAIPHARFIEMLTYKAELAGIVVKVIEESYTSKCSFLDNEPCVKHSEYKGKRIKRGLFRAGDGRLINADVNGSANIIRKAFPNAYAEGIQGVVVRPVRVTPYKMVVRGKCNICL
ncbi:RNA-guided endonuclease InsQ/TnpB family protein [Argonema antarcticum]|uniref:RNA-guided endonuclease InsQ/TnpB family protein n=1 Tax=Argonema antarcticum TaxID=2942763 RepID=UPI002010DFA3|nr:transposase [Argonema antarcticum]MCL1474958.1 transposase [Argonema antarcticum A004/B2]